MSGLASFVTGLGTGYISAQDKILERERQNRLDAQNADIHNARMDELNQAKNLRISLADAAKPIGVQETPGVSMAPGEMGPSQTPLSLASFKVGDANYLDRGQADAAKTTANSPAAVTSRQAAALRNAGAPDRAISLENANTQQQREQENHQKSLIENAKKLQSEGVFNAARALRSGDASGFAASFNADGQHKIVGQPELVQENRDVPGVGTIPTYTVKFKMQGPDGTVTDQVRNSHDLSMQLLPFEKAMELQRKGSDSDNKATYQGALIEAKTAALEAKTAAAAAKAKGGSDGVSREERLRYTSLFSDAGRRAGEAQRALSTLQRDPMYSMAKPGSPQAQEMQDLRDSIKAHNEERSTYQSLLAGSQTAPSLSSAKPQAPAKPKAASANGDYSNLWK